MVRKKLIKRRGAVYVITSKGLKELAEVTGQGRLIAKTLKRMRKATAQELRGRMGKNFKTKNVAASVIGVYLNRFKRAGLLAAKIPAKG
jgi:DNA-binding PadR family transcriptional regulator